VGNVGAEKKEKKMKEIKGKVKKKPAHETKSTGGKERGNPNAAEKP